MVWDKDPGFFFSMEWAHFQHLGSQIHMGMFWALWFDPVPLPRWFCSQSSWLKGKSPTPTSVKTALASHEPPSPHIIFRMFFKFFMRNLIWNITKFVSELGENPHLYNYISFMNRGCISGRQTWHNMAEAWCAWRWWGRWQMKLEKQAEPNCKPS